MTFAVPAGPAKQTIPGRLELAADQGANRDQAAVAEVPRVRPEVFPGSAVASQVLPVAADAAQVVPAVRAQEFEVQNSIGFRWCSPFDGVPLMLRQQSADRASAQQSGENGTRPYNRVLTITMYPSQEIRDVVLRRRRTQGGRVSCTRAWLNSFDFHDRNARKIHSGVRKYRCSAQSTP